ncbi:MAG TPA: RidA family protein [Candidatus Binatia bacterium]|nr:RidA family protein [Candidatus Binatia bacterium]
MGFELLNPEGLEAPVGYSHLAVVTGGKLVYVAGQAPFDVNGQVIGRGDFVAQFSQVLRNLKTAVEAAGGQTHHYAVLTIYLTDLQAYLNSKKVIGAGYRDLFGKYFPAITLVEVKSLYNPDCMVEISGVAVID